MSEPVFDGSLKRVMEGCIAIGTQRGTEYEDSWHLDNLVTTFTRAALRELGVQRLSPEQMRLLLLAALIDVKDSRMGGPWKRDSVEDGLNYRAVFLDLMEQYRASAGAVVSRKT